MPGIVSITSFQDGGFEPDASAVVAVDVIRATTTAVTAAVLGRRCFPVRTLDEAAARARELERPLLVGEQRGMLPPGFDLNNSPAALAERDDLDRPVVLLSSSGTQLICAAHAAGNGSVYVACLRNYTAQARELAQSSDRVSLVGAGSRGEFREEDQLCCAWIAAGLIAAGWEPENDPTAELVERWHGAGLDAVSGGRSAAYLRSSGQTADLDFILAAVDDVDAVFPVRDGEIVMAQAGA